MTDITYAYPNGVLYKVDVPRRCATCQFWDVKMQINGYATCYQLVYGKDWRLSSLEHSEPGDASIVRTHKEFVCKYWDARDDD